MNTNLLDGYTSIFFTEYNPNIITFDKRNLVKNWLNLFEMTFTKINFGNVVTVLEVSHCFYFISKVCKIVSM